jgi:hypothetical protein
MKGRSSFSQEEVGQIRSLLRKKAGASRSAQKAIRAQLRGIGFYVSDFGSGNDGFTESDFQDLIQTGAITLEGNSKVSLWQRLKAWWSVRRHSQKRWE